MTLGSGTERRRCVRQKLPFAKSSSQRHSSTFASTCRVPVQGARAGRKDDARKPKHGYAEEPLR